MSPSFQSASRTTITRLLAAMGLSLLMAAGAAVAQVPITATGTTGIDASGNAQKERQACMTDRTQQDQATCLREVNNAAAEKRSGKLDNSGAQFDANARQRCEVLTGEDRVACEARVMGYGNTQGSVAGGGVIREVETVVVPPGATSVRIEPTTNAPVLIVPAK
ncbi:MAG: hypothetical protein M3Q12_12685 [Pseudomonadota bacterium]|uniref:hypothetical protein n=1 Tax=Polaromonas sp. TaxID=1869339 RepID=UPI00185E8900|nr:hypothetical protein [Polaromonas sp.]MBA3594229.1 hypothetical protein [Polaromonas sp.]MDQ3273006.1 hypothetical protein [Pseudomonadota bacterium]